MSDVENKVLGKAAEENVKKAEKSDYFADSCIWQVSKNGCGKCLFSGRMVFEMMDKPAKDKVKSGAKEVKSGEFTFKLTK